MSLEGKIKQLMDERKLTQKELADQAGIAQATISRIMSGTVTNVERKTLDAIADVLRVTASDLLGEDPSPETKIFFRGYEKLSSKGKGQLKDFLRFLEENEERKPKRPG